MKESSVYMHFCGWYLRECGNIWLVGVFMGVGVLVLGVSFHALEVLTR